MCRVLEYIATWRHKKHRKHRMWCERAAHSACHVRVGTRAAYLPPVWLPLLNEVEWSAVCCWGGAAAYVFFWAYLDVRLC